jgi:hypothetical protein
MSSNVHLPLRGAPRARETGGPAAWTSSRGLFSQRLSVCWFTSRRGADGVGFAPPPPPDEVLSPFVGGDVEVCFPEQLFGGGRRLLQYGSDEGRVIGSLVEVLNHCCLGDLGDAISHGLKPLEVRPKRFIPSATDGFEVPLLRRLVGEGLEVGDKTPTEVAPIIDAMSG